VPERTLTPVDPAWPKGLTDLPDPPSALRVRGELPSLSGAVAVVGTRYADDDGLSFARQLGRDLASAGRAVISGGALGIDAAAHRGALDVGGATVSVLASGFAPAYPHANRNLFAAIERSGALLSEAPDGVPPDRWTFLRRNRLVAALAETVVVVQAPLRSGALSTAAIARKLERPVLSVPYAPWDARGAGCVQLLRRGARICTSLRDVLSVPAREAGKGPESATEAAPEAEARPAETTLDVSQLDDQGRAVWRALGTRPVHADNLARTLGVPIMRVQHALLELLVLGLAVEPSPGRYARKSESTAR
jgi:DNA processing protein